MTILSCGQLLQLVEWHLRFVLQLQTPKVQWKLFCAVALPLWTLTLLELLSSIMSGIQF